MRYYVLFARLCHRLMKLLRRIAGIKKTVYVQERVPFYREMWRSAAEQEGFRFVPLSESIWEVRDGERRVARMNNYIISLDDPVTLDMAGDKLLTYRLLAEAGVTIPKHAGITLQSLAQMRAFLDDVPGPYVVKPARNTSSGLGITTHLRTLRDCLDAAALAFTYSDEILIEEHVAGESYRLLFLGNEMISAVRRRGVRVEGDGKKTVAELLAEAHLTVRHDADVVLTLTHQGLSRELVPRSGQILLARSTGPQTDGRREVRTVYNEDVTDKLCAGLIEEGGKASLALGSEFCGVDVITVDPSVPLQSSKGRITEINTTPGLHHHYDLGPPGRTEPLARAVLRHIARKSV
jgi:cyanophycin synthetase